MSVPRAFGRRRTPTTPLAACYREQPLWWDDATFPASSPDHLPQETEVIVVGAGYTGTAAALELRKCGQEVLVLDRSELGRGASGRNAGMVHAGLRHDLVTLEHRFGALGRGLHEASVDAHRFVARLAAEVAPDADYSPRGWLYLADGPGRARRLHSAELVRRQSGERTRLLDGDALQEETRCSGVVAGLLTDNGAGVHPARLLAGMQRAALDAGARIAANAAVIGVERRNGAVVVRTTCGDIVARDVLVACNGYTDSAFPALRRRVIPIGSYIIATEPLAPELASSVSRHGRMMSDNRNFLHYWRLSPDQRLVFGGRASFADITVAAARDQLYTAMLRLYPQLAGVRVAYAWSGIVGFTFDRLPHMGRAGDVAYAMGYCGSGVAMASWMGTLAARWIACGERNPFLDRSFPTLPGYRGSPWFLPLVGGYYRLRDAIS